MQKFLFLFDLMLKFVFRKEIFADVLVSHERNEVKKKRPRHK